MNDPYEIAKSAIDLFLEFRDRHGFDEDEAKRKALLEIIEYLAMEARAEL